MLRLLLLLISSLYLWADAHILVYHRFADPRYPSTNTSLQELEKEFRYLKEHGYEVIPLARLVQAIKNEEPIQDHWVVITIDDGFKSFLKALPLFQKYGYPFTIFVSTEPTSKGYPDFLTWKQLKKLTKTGEIAFHSHTHPHLTDQSDEAIREDTKIGIDLFMRHLGFAPRFYAYPYGEYDERVKKIIKSFGFDGIVKQDRGAVAGFTDPYELPRIAMVGRSDLEKALGVEALRVEWIEPTTYPKDGILRRVKARIDPSYTNARLYVSGHGWRRVEVKNGLIDEKLDYKLDKKRVRVIIKVKNSKIDTKLLVRSRHGAK